MDTGIRFPPKWSRLRFCFRPGLNAALVTIVLVGTLIRVEHVVPSEVSVLLSMPNWLFSLVFPGLSLNSFKIVYIGALLQVAANLLFTLGLPRDIQVSDSKGDYADRLCNNITYRNLMEWISVTQAWPEATLAFSDSDRAVLENLRRHVEAKHSSGSAYEVNARTFDIIHTLAVKRYDYLNTESHRWLRIVIVVLLATASVLGGIASSDAVVRTLLAF